MKYAKLLALGRSMSPEEVTDSLKALANDSRFAAVVRLLDEQKELAADGSAQLKFAPSHGCLAHAAGVRYGLLELEGRIKQATETHRKSGVGQGKPPIEAEPS